jgi:three-Cys-motif partner protein
MLSQYTWKNGYEAIQQHSIAKHRILQTYLAKYFQTLVGNRPRDEFKLTLVDGFAGGGVYFHNDTKEIVRGSPFICLDAEREAEYEINKNRTKPVRVEVTHIFVEAAKAAYSHLDDALRKEGYGNRIGSSIQLRKGKFEDEVDSIIEFVAQKSPRSGRSLFILDQFGYNAVSTKVIQKIFNTLKKSEIILTFAVDSLFNYANENNLEASLKRIHVPNIFRDQPLSEIKKSDRNWRLFVQSSLYNALISECQAKHYTPFFIRNETGHGDYWLIHLSQHQRARSVMTDVHWENQNSFIHYGGAGLDMFNMVGYDPQFDNDFLSQNILDFGFDNTAAKASVSKMMDQIPKLITEKSIGITFGQFYENTCNQSPASLAIYKESMEKLIAYGELDLIGANNLRRTKASQIELTDKIIKPKQINFFPRY